VFLVILKIVLLGLCAVVLPIISASQEAEIRKIMVQGQPRQNVGKTPSQSTSQAMVVCICDLSYVKGWAKFWARIRKKKIRIWVWFKR
jgi:uncharacterized membrane protein